MYGLWYTTPHLHSVYLTTAREFSPIYSTHISRTDQYDRTTVLFSGESNYLEESVFIHLINTSESSSSFASYFLTNHPQNESIHSAG